MSLYYQISKLQDRVFALEKTMTAQEKKIKALITHFSNDRFKDASIDQVRDQKSQIFDLTDLDLDLEDEDFPPYN